jgi:hypothetical protein
VFDSPERKLEQGGRNMVKATDDVTQSPPTVEKDAAEAVVEPTEPTTEELKQAVLTLTEQGGKDKQEVKRLQGVIRSQGVTKQDIETLRQEFGGMSDWVAEALDKQNQGGAGELNEKPTASYTEQLTAKRKAEATAQASQPLSEEQQLFYGYMISQGLTIESTEVQEALSDNRNFSEAREHLKGTIAGTGAAARKAEITAAVQETLKQGGLTQGGVGAPTAGSTGYTLDKIKNMSDEEIIQNAEAINKAMVEGKLK